MYVISNTGAGTHSLFDLVALVCEHWIHDGVEAHMWIIRHGGRRYIGPFGREMCDEPGEVGVSREHGPLIGMLGLREGAELHLQYDIGSTTNVRLVCTGVGPAASVPAASASWHGGIAAQVQCLKLPWQTLLCNPIFKTSP